MPYITKSKKSKPIATLVEEAIAILEAVGIPIDNLPERRLERRAITFLSATGIVRNWADAKGLAEGHCLTTKELVRQNNQYFEESQAIGSYDDIWRKDLKPLVLADLVQKSAKKPNAATNDGTRGYALEPTFLALVRQYGTASWSDALQIYLAGKTLLKDELARQRQLTKIPVTLPNGSQLEFTPGQHNLLQKLIIEEFLPRFGQGCQLLYVGDTAQKTLFLDEKILNEIQFFELAHDQLPDVIAYRAANNWLYLIEAVHSTGPISEIRMIELKKLTRTCKAEIIYITAFLNRESFRKWAKDIAWESEVWIADNPDHLIHFNGHKFLGPYQEKTQDE